MDPAGFGLESLGREVVEEEREEGMGDEFDVLIAPGNGDAVGGTAEVCGAALMATGALSSFPSSMSLTRPAEGFARAHPDILSRAQGARTEY
tara:strand:+ start:466 stop:741 length:276 start_codon:yes stop_codon:yes gene_type:complete